jgi:hypothetical protein
MVGIRAPACRRRMETTPLDVAFLLEGGCDLHAEVGVLAQRGVSRGRRNALCAYGDHPT